MSSALLMRGVAALSTAALTVGLFAASPSQATLAPADGGQALAWGVAGSEPIVLPASLATTPILDIEGSERHAIALTAAGQVVMHTTDPEWENVPAAVTSQKTTSIATNPDGVFAAVTADGALRTWGSPAPVVGSADVSNLTSLSIGGGHALGIKADHTVVAWGENENGETTVPPGLTDVVKVAAGSDHSYALKSDGTLVSWGRDHRSQVSHAPTTGVKDIVARSNGGLALLNDGTITSWGERATATAPGAKYNLPPSSLDGKTIIKISGGSNSNLAVDADGLITTWGSEFAELPAELDGRTLSDISATSLFTYAIQRKVMQISTSGLAGTAKQGSVLTGTPATFTGDATVSHQWLVNGSPIAGATTTTLKLGTAQVGKKIVFRTVATQDGVTLTSDSAASATVAPLKVASRTAISKPKVKKTKVSFTVKTTRSGGTPTGKVKILVKRGSKTVYKKTLTLKKGSAKVTIKKLKKGKHKVTASYVGDTRSNPSTAKSVKFRVR